MLNQVTPTDQIHGAGFHPGGQRDESTSQDEGISVDDLIINKDSVQALEKSLRKIKDRFKVEIDFGMVATEETIEKQWISLKGKDEDRNSAKSYIKALCSPGETYPYTYPDEIHEILTNPTTIDLIEKRSNAVVVFHTEGQITIQGEDDLPVTLALSLIDDIVQQCYKPDPTSPKSANHSSSRLDSEIRRLSSQKKELYDEDFDINNIESLPPAVKRTFLEHYHDPDPCKSEKSRALLDKDQTIPMTLVGNVPQFTVSKPPVVNLHPKSGKRTPSPEPTTSKGDSAFWTQDGSDLSLSLSLEKTSETQDIGLSRQPIIDLNRQREKSVILMDTDDDDVIILNDSPLPFEHTSDPFSRASNEGGNEEVRRYALGQGYTKEEIDVVEKDFGCLLTAAEFIKALLTNRKLKTEQHAVTVNELEEAQIGRKSRENTQKTNNLPPTKLAPVSSDAPGNTAAAGKSSIAAAKKDAQGKAKGDVLATKRRQGGAEGRSPVRHPLEQIFPSSPQDRKNSKKEKDSKKGLTPEVYNYLEALGKDYQEENNGSFEDIRKNNERRREILQQFLELQDKKKTGNEEEENRGTGEQQDEESDYVMDWAVVQRDGRHNSPNTKAVKVDEQNPPKLDQRDRPQPAKNKVMSTKKNTTQQKRSRSPQKNPSTNAGQGIDALDDIEMPPQRQNKTYQEIATISVQNSVKPLTHNAAHFNMGERRTRFDQPQPQNTQPHDAGNRGDLFSPQSNLRYIVIDGSNVAMAHGNHTYFSCRGIKICVDFFRRRGHKEITAFVPQWRTTRRENYPIQDQDILEELQKEGILVFTPARKYPGKQIICYDDKFVLRLAEETDGIVVSNDNYRDLWREKREWRELIEKRLLMFSFVGDIFMPPDDPLGRNGPDLDQFLRKSNNVDMGYLYQETPNFQRLAMHRQPNPWLQQQRHQVQPQNTGFHQFSHMRQQNPRFQQIPHQQQNPRFQQVPQTMQQNPGFQQRFVNPRCPANNGPKEQGKEKTKQIKNRDPTETEWLRSRLLEVFPSDEEKINELLIRKSSECNLQKMLNFMMDLK